MAAECECEKTGLVSYLAWTSTFGLAWYQAAFVALEFSRSIDRLDQGQFPVLTKALLLVASTARTVPGILGWILALGVGLVAVRSWRTTDCRKVTIAITVLGLWTILLTQAIYLPVLVQFEP